MVLWRADGCHRPHRRMALSTSPSWWLRIWVMILRLMHFGCMAGVPKPRKLLEPSVLKAPSLQMFSFIARALFQNRWLGQYWEINRRHCSLNGPLFLGCKLGFEQFWIEFATAFSWSEISVVSHGICLFWNSSPSRVSRAPAFDLTRRTNERKSERTVDIFHQRRRTSRLLLLACKSQSGKSRHRNEMNKKQ